MDTSKPEVIGSKMFYVEEHMISTLLCVFSSKELNELRGTITASILEQPNWFLRERKAQKFGILRDITDKICILFIDGSQNSLRLNGLLIISESVKNSFQTFFSTPRTR
jgi:hypothetical protein